MIKTLLLSLGLFQVSCLVSADTNCADSGISVQILGSGGPELDDARASSGYILWYNGRARLLVDIGSGSLLRFEQSGASLENLDAILISHLHVDHTSDLPALIKASYFTERNRDLNLYGPEGNALMPSTSSFIQGLFGPDGVYRYLRQYLSGVEDYRLIPNDIDIKNKSAQLVISDSSYQVHALSVHHGPLPALAWRVNIDGKRIVFSGDMNNEYGTLSGFAKNADMLIAHHAIPEGASGVARNLHMPPSEIGRIAKEAGVKRLVLSHRMNRSIGKESFTLEEIRKRFDGVVKFAEDLQCYSL